MTKRVLSIFLGAVAVGLVVPSLFSVQACSSDSDNGGAQGETGNGGDKEKICRDYVNRMEKCEGKQNVEKYEKDCHEMMSCSPLMQSGAVERIFRCLASVPCGANDDTCYAEEAGKYVDDPDLKSFAQTCMAKYYNECHAGPQDLCRLAIYNKEALKLIGACFDESCEKMGSCVQNVFQSHAPGCNF